METTNEYANLYTHDGRRFRIGAQVTDIHEIGPEDACPMGYIEFGHTGPILVGTTRVELLGKWVTKRVHSGNGHDWTLW
jgi:hypothetical protein